MFFSSACLPACLPTFTQCPRESPERAAYAFLAAAGGGGRMVLRLVELQLERLRVEVDLLLGLVPGQREGGDAVDAREDVSLPEACRLRLASRVHL